jgi:two-component system, NarL family, response regulator NreC
VDELVPDVVVLDVVLRGLDGIEVARRVAAKARVLVFSTLLDEAHVTEALRNGASGYLGKSALAEEILAAIREVSSGHRYLAAPLWDRAIEVYARKQEAAALDPYERLTAREREVFHLCAEGCGNVEIGRRLCISARTVEVHRSNMMRKLNLASTVALVRYALQRGIV